MLENLGENVGDERRGEERSVIGICWRWHEQRICVRLMMIVVLGLKEAEMNDVAGPHAREGRVSDGKVVLLAAPKAGRKAPCFLPCSTLLVAAPPPPLPPP